MADEVSHQGPGRTLRRVFFRGALLGLLALGAANAYLVETTAGDIVNDVAAAPRRSVAIVLGNSVFKGGVLSWGLAARVQVALDLYEAGKVEKIFLSGAYRPADGYDEPGAMASWLERHGVPRSVMILDRMGHRTAATMADAARQGFHDAIICTQRFHQPRCLYLARHEGITATGVAADNHGGVALDYARAFIREWLARAETLVEVAVRAPAPPEAVGRSAPVGPR
jgi:SanA protein